MTVTAGTSPLPPVLVPEWPEPVEGIAALSTLRAGGVSLAPYDDGAGGTGLNLGVHVGDRPEHVAENRRRLRALLPSEPAWLSQVHGAIVADAAEAAAMAMTSGALAADASVTAMPGVVCAIQTADCLPVLFCDPKARVVGAAHAGWRGLASGVLENTAERMRAQGAHSILAWLGPAIGPERFEVGQDVLDAFAARSPANRAAFIPIDGKPGKYLADIYALARFALGRAGIDAVSGGGRCTIVESSDFYSYRRDGVTGRMASLIWIK